MGLGVRARARVRVRTTASDHAKWLASRCTKPAW